MGGINNAINEGIRTGIERAWTDQCNGRDDPEERCPMRPADGCSCYRKAYMAAPFWRRWQMEKPKRPSQDAVLTALVGQQVDALLPLALAERGRKACPSPTESEARS